MDGALRDKARGHELAAEPGMETNHSKADRLEHEAEGGAAGAVAGAIARRPVPRPTFRRET
jgi:hypothetical protein